MKSILIIDDENDIANNIKAILDDENYFTTTANNSFEAFSYLDKKEYDLIILDVWLDNSELDGLNILKKIWLTSKVPIIIISGHGNIDMAVQAIKDGANEFIEKPFTSERLLLSVKRSIELFEVKNENDRLKHDNIFDYEFIGDQQQ